MQQTISIRCVNFHSIDLEYIFSIFDNSHLQVTMYIELVDTKVTSFL